MSTEQSVDPELVEHTKQQIRSLVNEIAQLTRQDLTLQEFYSEFLSRVVSALAAIGGAVWAPGEGGAMDLQYQINLRETGLPDSQDDLIRHGRLIHRTFMSGEGALVQPQSGDGDESLGSNPTDLLLVLGPIKIEEDTKGIVEIFQRPGARTITQRGYLRFLQQMCELAADFLKSRQLRHFTDRQTLWNQLESFTRVAHQSLDPRESAYTIANEGRRLIECDRVSVAIVTGRKCRIEAVSGQDTFDRRSNTIHLLTRLATAVVATGEPMWYSGDTSDMAPQVEDAVQAYVDDSHSKNVAVLPLKRPGNPDDERDSGETIGALIVEQIEDARPREGTVQRVKVVCDHSSTALANALEHNDLFLMPLWRTLGKATWLVKARTLPKTIAVATAILATVVVLSVVPADFNLEAKGSLQPVARSDVFASFDGRVKELFVEHGDQVKKGAVLAELENDDLQVAIEKVRGDIRGTEESMQATQRLLYEVQSSSNDARNRSTSSDVEKGRLSGELNALKAKLDGLKKELQLREEQRKQLQITSPITGIVTEWDLVNQLQGRPVKAGQILMRIANPDSDWELELRMPEDRMGQIARAQKEMGDTLKVTYFLATDPGVKHEGTIKQVHLSAEVRGDEGNTVLVKVKIDKNELARDRLANLRQGAGLTAKVYCGRRAIGYVWFHDLVGFVQSRILFRIF